MSEWLVDFDGYSPIDEGRRETLCTLGNGVFATRGAISEADADGVHYPGTYAAGVFNRLVSHVQGETLEHESMPNLPNWLTLRLRPHDGSWLDPAEVELVDHSRQLDLRRGILWRRFTAIDEKGRKTAVVERRLVSMARPNLAAVELTITPLDWSGRLEILSAIDGTVENRNVVDEHALEGRHLSVVDRGADDRGTVWLVAETVQSHVRVALAAHTRLLGSGKRLDATRERWAPTDKIGELHAIEVTEGTSIVVEKVCALSTSRDPAISEPSLAARTLIDEIDGFDALAADHEQAWGHLWEICHLDLEADDGDEASQILNLHLFHLLQTLSPNVVDRDVGVPARGLHGEAYRGHLFWDELYIFPILNLRMPDLTRELLLYRYRRLDAARRLARAEGRPGAMFPWQSGSDGREETPTQLWNPLSESWMPDHSRRQRHVGLAVALNVWQYFQVTEDVDFMVSYGAEMLIELARFFADLAEHDPTDDRFHIRGVMGPDEFQDGYPDRPGEGIDDNAYTNVLTSWLLCRAGEMPALLERHHGHSVLDRLGVADSEIRLWDVVSRRLHVPFTREGFIAQFAGFDDLEDLDWARYRATYDNIGRLDLILESEGDSMNRYRASKQADTLMLFYLFSPTELTEIMAHLGYDFDPATIHGTIDYYLARTSNGSSLSRVAHAWVLSRADRERSWEGFREALQLDIADTQGGTTREGIHLGAMAGTIDLVQRCYTGIETREGALWFQPQLPTRLRRLAFTLNYRGHRIDVEVTHDHLRLRSHPCDAPAVRVCLNGDLVMLQPGESISADLSPESHN